MAAHLGGEEAPDGWQGLLAHLETCPACRAEAESLARTWQTLVTLPDARVPAGAWERIQARLPAPGPARRAPWAARLATAALGLFLSIAASWLLSYERAARLCGDGLRRLFPTTSLPDPAIFFAIGLLYGLLPLGLAALVSARRLARTGRYPGVGASVVFGALALPYVIIACSGLPTALAGALLAGIIAGALAGGPAGLWVGGKFFPRVPV